MKRFIPLIIWFILSILFLYFVKNYLILKFPQYSREISVFSAAIVLIVFFVVKDRVLSYPKEKQGGKKEHK